LSSFTASANGTTLTVTGTVTGGPLQIGSYLNPSFGAPIATYISALGTGTGGAGTYTLSNNAGTIVSASTTALYAVGVGYAINPQCLLKTGATYWLGCEGGEIDISALAGTSPAAVAGLVIAVASSHASHGFLGTDSAIVIGGGSSVTGWDHGIRFGGANQVYSPFATTATLLYVAHAMTVVNFMDFSLGTATANVLKASGGSIDGSFNILAPSVSNGSAGLTVALTGSKLGFYGATPIVKATPTGACAGNTGCQALRDALGAVGLINTGSISN
jgi:hypothetical protein